MPPTATVFLVDDDPSVRRGVTRLLLSAGFTVVAFESGKDFLEQATLSGAHCVVLDVRMPGMTGPEVVRAMRARGYDSRVVFITGHDPADVRKEFPRDAILVKPIDGEKLIEAVRASLVHFGT